MAKLVRSPEPTVYSVCEALLRRLCAAVHQDPTMPDRAVGILEDLRPALGDRPLVASPQWSGVCDDCSPWELSIAFDGDIVDVRLLVEAHSDPATSEGYARAGRELTARMVERLGCSDEPLRMFGELFPVGIPELPFAYSHAVEFRHDGNEAGKIYLGTEAHPRGAAYALERVADELGMMPAWRDLLARGEAVGRHRMNIVSFDLLPARQTRCKVYMRRWDASIDDLDREYQELSGGAPGELGRFVRTVMGGTNPRLTRRPIYCVYHLDRGERGVSKLVVDLPMVGNVANDAEAHDRILRALDDLGLSSRAYRDAVAAIGPGALAETLGFHSYVSLQPSARGPRVTTYFNPCLYVHRHGFDALWRESNWWEA